MLDDYLLKVINYNTFVFIDHFQHKNNKQIYNNELIFQTMYNNRQNIDLNAMLNKESGLSKPRGPTPIRKAPVRPVNKENVVNLNNQWTNPQMKNNINPDERDPYAQDNQARKPLISPVRNPFKTQIQNIHAQQKRGNKPMPGIPNRQKPVNQGLMCANHPNKSAQFNIQIDQQCLAYCGRCAAQLASQGFQVIKIEQPTIKKGDYRLSSQFQNSQGRQLPKHSQYQGNPMYELILEFLTQLSQVENQHLQNMTKLTMIDGNYNQQIQHTKFFYSQLMSFIEQMRDDHLNDLYEESRKHSQIADIQHDYLRENIDQINNIRRDIQENLQTIVEKIEEYDLKNNLNYYRQKLQVYRHKVQEQSEFFGKVISFSAEQYQSKLGRVQDFLMEVWSTDDQVQSQHIPQQSNRFAQNFMPTQNKPPLLKKQVQNYMNPRGNQGIQNVGNGQGQKNNMILQKKGSNQMAPQDDNKNTAFRKLFQEQDAIIAETSPQFKKI